MQYNRDPDDDETMQPERTIETATETAYDVFDDWVETWRDQSRADNVIIDNDTKREMYEDAKDRVERHGMTDPSWDAILAPYETEADAMDITGYFVSAVAAVRDEDTMRFSSDSDAPIGGLGYRMAEDELLQIDCTATYPGHGADGIIVNDGHVDSPNGLYGVGMIYINRGETDELPHMGQYAVGNTGTIDEDTYIPYGNPVLNFGKIEHLKPKGAVTMLEDREPEPHIIDQGLIEGENSLDDYVADIPPEHDEILEKIEQLLTAEEPDQIRNGIEQWDAFWGEVTADE